MAPAAPKPPASLDRCPKCDRQVYAESASPSSTMRCDSCGLPLTLWSGPQGLEVFDRAVAEKTIAIVAADMAVPIAQVTPGVTFDDLGADSLQVVETSMKIESAFDFTFADEESEMFGTHATVGDAIRAVQLCLRRKKA